MKSTRYFDDYQSAYNYYGGNVVPSTEIALIGNGSYIFVSSDNAVSGNTQYFDASMTNDEIVDTMTYTAYNNGVAYGTTYGEAIGYTTGHTAGYSEGYSYGYSYGYTEGQAAGGSMTDTDITKVAIGDLTNYYYNTYNRYDTFNYHEYVDLGAISGDSIQIAISNLLTSTVPMQPFNAFKYENGAFTLVNGTNTGESEGWIQWTGSLTEGDKVCFALANIYDNGEGNIICEGFTFVAASNNNNLNCLFECTTTGSCSVKIHLDDFDPVTNYKIVDYVNITKPTINA